MFFDLNVIQLAVIEFQHAMDQDILNIDRHTTLVLEEAAELEEAIMDFQASPSVASMEHVLKEFGDFMYVSAGYFVAHQVTGDARAEVIRGHEAVGLAEIAIGDALDDFIGLEAVRRIHKSNMSKLDDDGKPVYREEDGKVLKGPNYKPPYLRDLAVLTLYRWRNNVSTR